MHSKIDLLKNFENFTHCIVTYFFQFWCGNKLEDVFTHNFYFITKSFTILNFDIKYWIITAQTNC